MKHRVSLFEFMPYGAPELLQGARPHMARALTVGSALWVALFATALAIVSALPRPANIPIRIDGPITFDPPPIFETPPKFAPETPPPPAPAKADKGVILPVPPAEAPPAVETRNDAIGTPDGTGVSTQPSLVVALPTGDVEGPPPIVHMWETDVLPEVVTEVKPIYPDLARQAGIDGRVVVEVTIGPNGHVEEAHVVRSIPVLDAAAVDAALRWVFTKPLANGHPVRVRYSIPFVFVLH